MDYAAKMAASHDSMAVQQHQSIRMQVHLHDECMPAQLVRCCMHGIIYFYLHPGSALLIPIMIVGKCIRLLTIWGRSWI